MIKYKLSIEELTENKVFENAKLATLGGVSRLRGEGEERQATCADDNLVGQICNYAGAKWAGSVALYHKAREMANANPHAGDGGDDLPPFKIDIKGSLMRNNPDPLSYNLPVRPKERHKGVTYVLALTDCYGEYWLTYLVGWCKEEDLPTKVAEYGPLSGAFVVPARELKKMPPEGFLRKSFPEHIA